MNNLLSALKQYFESHSAQEIAADWEAVSEYDNIGITLNDVIFQYNQYEFVMRGGPSCINTEKQSKDISSEFSSSFFNIGDFNCEKICGKLLR